MHCLSKKQARYPVLFFGNLSEGGEKLILILQNQNNDSGEFVRIKIMILSEIDSDSRIKVMILESIAY